MVNCDQTGCPHEAKWMPVLLIYADKSHGEHPPARATIGLHVCEWHKATMSLEHFMDDRGWQMVVSNMKKAGYAAPVRERTKLTYIPIE